MVTLIEVPINAYKPRKIGFSMKINKSESIFKIHGGRSDPN